ncbi:site-specific integrase [Candidatus Daviesbacteria bacterium]|nr:site-specific integrase [Candidatus Daviesbacteria bacterium]
MTLSVLITDFLEYLEVEQNASQLTIRNYDHYLKRFLEFAGDTPPKDINPQLIKKYKQHLAKKNLKKVTQNYFLIALRSFLRYLADQNIDSLPAEDITLSSHRAVNFPALDQAALNRLFNSPDLSKKAGLRDRAILETLFSSGLRISKVSALNRDDLTVGEWLEKYLLLRKDTFKPLFIRFQGKVDPGNNGERMRLSPRSIQRLVEKYAKRAGLSARVTPEILRKSAGADKMRL